MPTAKEYTDAYEQMGRSFVAVARHFGVHESTVRRSVQRAQMKSDADPALQRAMDAMGVEGDVGGAWIKSHTPDAEGRTYSFYMRGAQADVEAQVSTAERVAAVFKDMPPVRLPAAPVADPGHQGEVGFIPLNDLHAGAYAWSDETGYGDWDLDIATARLTDWVGRLVNSMPRLDECILFYNGDTLHANDQKGMTPESGHILDTDTRHAKVVDATAAAMIVTVELAAARHRKVRVVIKKGNHDKDSHIALRMALKYRYQSDPRVIVDEDPSPYWAYRIGQVFLFGHHGDKVKPEQLVMKMAADNRHDWGLSRYSYIWTAHLHNKEVVQHYGTIVERASCLTEPDVHGARWGSNAQAVAVIYHPERGEIQRATVRA